MGKLITKLKRLELVNLGCQECRVMWIDDTLSGPNICPKCRRHWDIHWIDTVNYSGHEIRTTYLFWEPSDG